MVPYFDELPDVRYIVLAYGTKNELEDLATKMFSELDLAIFSTGLVCSLVLIYDVNIGYIKK